jgi:hypothetical protein
MRLLVLSHTDQILPARDLGMIANNSFKPMPLRGTA